MEVGVVGEEDLGVVGEGEEDVEVGVDVRQREEDVGVGVHVGEGEEHVGVGVNVGEGEEGEIDNPREEDVDWLSALLFPLVVKMNFVYLVLQ